ncbi:MAG: YggT family protein [Acidimicrobiales bacterium]
MVSHLLCLLLQAYLVAIFVGVVLSWFPSEQGSLVDSIRRLVYTITEPVLGPIRRVLPPMGAGGMGFDFSPIIVILVMYFVLSLLGCPTL